MDKTHKGQGNTSFESHLWQGVSDEAAAACVGGSKGELKSIIKGVIYRLLQVIRWGKYT